MIIDNFYYLDLYDEILKKPHSANIRIMHICHQVLVSTTVYAVDDVS